jgi:CBS domain-containing protein
MWASDPRTGLEILSVTECYTLLATQSLGRLAVTTEGGLPMIFPVGYVVDGRAIAFRSAPGTKLTAARHRPVAFEVDAADPTRGSGWSVVAAGRAEPVVHEAAIERLEARRIPQWTNGSGSGWMRLHPGAISGRRIAPHPEDPLHEGVPTVSSLPTVSVVALHPDASLADVSVAMVHHGVSVVLVGDVTVTERDLTRAFARGLSAASVAREHSGRRPVTLGPTASAVDAALAMVRAEAHHLVVVDMGRPVAMVTLADTLAALLRAGELPAWLAGLRLALHVPADR